MSARVKPLAAADDSWPEKLLPAVLLAASAALYVVGRILERIGGRR